jgi:hypothetical protein
VDISSHTSLLQHSRRSQRPASTPDGRTTPAPPDNTFTDWSPPQSRKSDTAPGTTGQTQHFRPTRATRTNPPSALGSSRTPSGWSQSSKLPGQLADQHAQATRRVAAHHWTCTPRDPLPLLKARRTMERRDRDHRPKPRHGRHPKGWTPPRISLGTKRVGLRQ